PECIYWEARRMKVPAPQEPTQCWRDCMDEFTVIPALDLKGDAVVHAKSGNRADYWPIESPYGAADDPFAIARGLLSHTASPSLYIADLDAIAGVGNHFELVRGLSYALPDTALWIDAGF